VHFSAVPSAQKIQPVASVATPPRGWRKGRRGSGAPLDRPVAVCLKLLLLPRKRQTAVSLRCSKFESQVTPCSTNSMSARR
jgi:hypothetical protein